MISIISASFSEDEVEKLIKALKQDSPYFKMEAAKKLGKIKDIRAVEPLITALKDESLDVRWAASEALGEIGDKRAIEPLKQLIEQDSIINIKNVIIEALQKINSTSGNETAQSKMERPRFTLKGDCVDDKYVEGLGILCLSHDERIVGVWQHDKQSDLTLAVQDRKNYEFLSFKSDGKVVILLDNLIALTEHDYSIRTGLAIYLLIGDIAFQYSIKGDYLTLIHRDKTGIYSRVKEENSKGNKAK